jgi:hypothetical protein
MIQNPWDKVHEIREARDAWKHAAGVMAFLAALGWGLALYFGIARY